MRPREEFARHLNALYAAAGCPSLRALAGNAQLRARAGRAPGSAVAVTAQRISDWKAGRNVPARFETLNPVLLVLVEAARRRGNTAGAVLNLRQWRVLWGQAQVSRSRVPGSGGTQRSAATTSSSAAAALSYSGRNRVIGSLIEMVDEAMRQRREGRVIALTGASGVGKSSLIAAGLAPALQKRDKQPITVRSTVVTPDSEQVLVSILSELRLRHGGGRGAVSTGRTPADITDAIVVVDQFEGVFTGKAPMATRDRIVALLGELAEVAVVLIGLRSSYIPDCYSYSLLADALEERRYQLEPMTTDELRATFRAGVAGTGNADAAGIEEVLIATICGIRGDAERFGREPAELPILLRTLSSMASNQKESTGHIDSYRALGGTKGVVHAMAEDLWAGLSRRQRAEAKRILLFLVDVHVDVGYVRRRIPLHEASELFDGESGSGDVFDLLVGARLITMDRHQVQLSHEMVLAWRRLGDWLEEAFPVWRTDRPSHRAERHLYRDRSWEYVALNPRPPR